MWDKHLVFERAYDAINFEIVDSHSTIKAYPDKWLCGVKAKLDLSKYLTKDPTH